MSRVYESSDSAAKHMNEPRTIYLVHSGDPVPWRSSSDTFFITDFHERFRTDSLIQFYDEMVRIGLLENLSSEEAEQIKTCMMEGLINSSSDLLPCLSMLSCEFSDYEVMTECVEPLIVSLTGHFEEFAGIRIKQGDVRTPTLSKPYYTLRIDKRNYKADLDLDFEKHNPLDQIVQVLNKVLDNREVTKRLFRFNEASFKDHYIMLSPIQFDLFTKIGIALIPEKSVFPGFN
jgi:hypothetical protein